MSVKIRVANVVNLYNALQLPRVDFQDALEQVLGQMGKGGVPVCDQVGNVIGVVNKGSVKIDGDNITVEVKFTDKEKERYFRDMVMTTSFKYSRMHNHVIVQKVSPKSLLEF